MTLLPTEEGLPSALRYRAGEDTVCADYLQALLQNQENASTQLAENMARLEAAGRFNFFTPGDFDVPFEDIALIKAVDRFTFVMVGKHKQWEGITYVEVEQLNVVR